MRQTLSRITIRILLVIGVAILIVAGIVFLRQEVQETAIEPIFLSSDTLISQVEWSPDGSKLAVMSWERLQVWDAVTWEIIATIPKPYVYEFAWHPTDDLIAGVRGGSDESLLVWDAQTGEKVRELSRARQPNTSGVFVLRTLAWHPDGDIIVSDSSLWDDIFLSWHWASADSPTTLLPWLDDELHHTSGEVAWSSDGQKLLSGGGDEGSFPYEFTVPETGQIVKGIASKKSMIHVWDVQMGKRLLSTAGTAPIQWGLNNEQFAGVGFKDGVAHINVWDLETSNVSVEYTKHSSSILSISWNLNNGHIASLDVNGNLAIWDAETGTEYYFDQVDLTFTRTLDWQPNSNWLAIGGEEGVLVQEFDIAPHEE